MWFLEQIISYLTSISDQFYDAYQEVIGWIFPFYYLAYPLYYLYIAFYWLAYYFAQFNVWVDSTASKLLTILSYANIYSYFKPYFDYAVSAWNWVYYAWSNVTNIINSWWSSASLTVQSWIDSARALLQLQIDNLMGLWLNLQVAWDDFKTRIPSIDEALAFFTNWWAYILVPLTSWWAERLSDVQGLINSAFLLRQDFWEGWQDIRDSVFEFFTDPLGWLEARFTDWFLGPEE